MLRLIRSPLFLISMLLLALTVRLYQIGSLSNDFHAIRQYSTAMMMRPNFLATQLDTPARRLEIARLNQQPLLEPPIIQEAALVAYQIAGREDLALPRAISAILWVMSGYFIYLIGKKPYSHETALVVSAFYLFAPFGILASRSFQPNPMMIALMVVSLYAIICYFENPTPRRLALAIVASASAIFVTIFAAFMIFLAYYGLSVQALGWRRATLNRRTLIFGFFSLLPAAIYYLYGLFIAGFLANQAGDRFVPSLWLTAGYWVNWANQVVGVIGLIPLILCIQSLVMLRRSKQAAFLRSLWVSYILFGLLLNYHIMSHSYYSLPLIPIAALTIGSVVQQIFTLLPPTRRKYIPGWSVALIAVIIVTGLAAYLPTTVVTKQQLQQAQSAQKIGETLDHTSETIFLTPDEGMTLEYQGEIAGLAWPGLAEINAEKLTSGLQLTAQERLQNLLSKHPYRYFVATSMKEFENQTDLVEYLNGHFPIMSQSDDYIIYRLDNGGDKAGVS